MVGFLGGATLTLHVLSPARDPATTVPQAENRLDAARKAGDQDSAANRFDIAFAPFSPGNLDAGGLRSDHDAVVANRNRHAAFTKAVISTLTNDWSAETFTRVPRDISGSANPERLITASLSQPNATPRASAPKVSIMNPLAGKTLRYLIGASSAGDGHSEEVTEVPYGAKPAKHGISIAYCNLFDEHNTGRYGPYLKTSDTARQYNEGQIDPSGPGWTKNLTEQFEQRKRQGFEYIELDNPDAYSIENVTGAIELAANYGLKVIAKNPGLLDRGASKYVAHPNVYGIIVEKGAGNAADMDALRRKAGKPDIPVWFVAFGSGRSWANNVAKAASSFRNMGVTYSSAGEYRNAEDVLSPAGAAGSTKI